VRQRPAYFFVRGQVKPVYLCRGHSPCVCVCVCSLCVRVLGVCVFLVCVCVCVCVCACACACVCCYVCACGLAWASLPSLPPCPLSPFTTHNHTASEAAVGMRATSLLPLFLSFSLSRARSTSPPSRFSLSLSLSRARARSTSLPRLPRDCHCLARALPCHLPLRFSCLCRSLLLNLAPR
jgi:hypothetical protein